MEQKNILCVPFLGGISWYEEPLGLVSSVSGFWMLSKCSSLVSDNCLIYTWDALLLAHELATQPFKLMPEELKQWNHWGLKWKGWKQKFFLPVKMHILWLITQIWREKRMKSGRSILREHIYEGMNENVSPKWWFCNKSFPNQ